MTELKFHFTSGITKGWDDGATAPPLPKFLENVKFNCENLAKDKF